MVTVVYQLSIRIKFEKQGSVFDFGIHYFFLMSSILDTDFLSYSCSIIDIIYIELITMCIQIEKHLQSTLNYYYVCGHKDCSVKFPYCLIIIINRRVSIYSNTLFFNDSSIII